MTAAVRPFVYSSGMLQDKGKHQKVSAEEKRAELGDQWPVCDCHGKPKRWKADDRRGGGYWECRVKARESQRKYDASEKGRETKRKYEKSEKGRETQRKWKRERYWSDPMYRVVKNTRRVANRNQRKRRALHGN